MAYKEPKVGRPPKYKDVKQVQEIIDRYFAECDENDEYYTMTGLAMALDMTRKGLVEYSEKEEFGNTIKKAKQRVEKQNEALLMSGKNVAGVIFNLKNNWGWVDKQEIEQHNTFDFDSCELANDET